jgi:hypothetical protein
MLAAAASGRSTSTGNCSELCLLPAGCCAASRTHTAARSAATQQADDTRTSTPSSSRAAPALLTQQLFQASTSGRASAMILAPPASTSPLPQEGASAGTAATVQQTPPPPLHPPPPQQQQQQQQDSTTTPSTTDVAGVPVRRGAGRKRKAPAPKRSEQEILDSLNTPGEIMPEMRKKLKRAAAAAKALQDLGNKLPVPASVTLTVAIPPREKAKKEHTQQVSASLGGPLYQHPTKTVLYCFDSGSLQALPVQLATAAMRANQAENNLSDPKVINAVGYNILEKRDGTEGVGL